MTEPEYRRIACEVLFQTDKAVQVQVDGAEHWLPASQLDPDHDLPEVGSLGVVYVATWLAEREGLSETLAEEDDELSPTIFECRKPIARELRRVRHPKFGEGSELSIEADKSIVHFDGEHSTRTILTRFITPC